MAIAEAQRSREHRREQLGAQVAQLQARLPIIESELIRLQREEGNYVSAYIYDSKQLNDRRAIAESRRRAEEATARVQVKRAERDEVREEIQTLTEELVSLHDRTILDAVLRGRTIGTFVPPHAPEHDHECTALAARIAQLTEQRREKQSDLEGLGADRAAAAARHADMRVRQHTDGGITPRELQAAEKDEASCEAKHAAVSREIADLGAAIDAVRAKREQRLEVLRRQVVPGLRAEERRRAQVCANTLRDAAVAMSELGQVVDALVRADVQPLVFPWHGLWLRLDQGLDHQLQLVRWILEGIEAGVIE